MPGINRYREAVNLVMETLASHDLESEQVQRGDIGELRGGIACLNIKKSNIDSAVIHTNINTSNYLTDNVKTVFKVDYAVRGNIKGVLPGRILSNIDVMIKGVLNRQITDLKWVVPIQLDYESGVHGRMFEAIAPNHGELWENGPHQSLAKILNSDIYLTKDLLSFVRTSNARAINVSSDLWNESIRINHNSWLPISELLTFFLSKKYTEIVDRISAHIKTVRRNFGGLTF